MCPILVLHKNAGDHRRFFPASQTAVALYRPGQGPQFIRVVGIPGIGPRLQRRVKPAHKLIRRQAVLCAGCLGRPPVLLVCIGHFGHFRHFLQIRSKLTVKCLLVIILFLRRHKPGGIQINSPHPLFLADAPALFLPHGVKLPAPVHILSGILVSLVSSPLHSRHKGALRDAYHADDEQDHQNQKGSRLPQSDGKEGGKDASQPSAARTGQGGLLIIFHPLRAGRNRTEGQLQQPADRNHSPCHGCQLHGSMDVSLVGQMETGAHKYQYGK